MQPGRNTQLADDLERIFEGKVWPNGDRALLDRFVGDRDEAAFEALVVRHGPMVRGICRRLLTSVQDVDDAFQATFLVLFLKSRGIGDADRLAPWLFGVATRVARKARAQAARRQARIGVGPTEILAPAPDHAWIDVMPLIDAEIAQLPAKLRQVVILCLVEGIPAEEAAGRLGCPVGTVRSRLARGREALRARLRRQGVTPSVALAALDGIAPAPVADSLVRLTLATCVAPLLAPTMIPLIRGVAPAMITKSTAVAALLVGSLVLAGGGLTTAWLKSSARGQPLAPPASQSQPDPAQPPAGSARLAPATKPPTTDEPKPLPVTEAARSTPAAEPMADRLARIKAEYMGAQTALWAAQAKAATPLEQNQLYSKMAPDEAAYCRRMIDLALTNPTDPAARDALIWVIDKPGQFDSGAYGDEFARAGALLIRSFGDDPVAVSVGLGKNNILSAHRDALLVGFYASAQSREAKGIACLALADYLAKKAERNFTSGKLPPRGKLIYRGMTGDDGKPYDQEVEEPIENYSYQIGLSISDPKLIRAEAEQLYNEVIASYGDVPWMNTWLREMTAMLKEPEPKHNGRPMTADEIQKLRAIVEPKRTLGPYASAGLDNMNNLVPGKTAPEIDGVTLDGKPLKLSDYRGKVVVLSFWESGCGPCIRAMPSENELAERLKGRPFALLGVDSEEDRAAGLKVIRDNQVTWPSWHDGGAQPIMARYHIASFPTVFVIDAAGIIRHKKISGKAIDKAVDDLLAEMAAKESR